MRSLTLHLKILIAILVILGIRSPPIRSSCSAFPITEDETDDLWNIDAKVEFLANPSDPVEDADVLPAAEPRLRQPQTEKLYLQTIRRERDNRIDGNRKVTWIAHAAPAASQTLYYRLVLTKRYSGEKHRGPRARCSATASPVEGQKNRGRSPAGAHPPALGRRRNLHQRSHQARQQPQ